MISTLKLKAKVAEKRSAAQKILDAVASGPTVREMSTEEKSQFDTLMSDVTTIKGQITQLQALEDDEAADEVETETPPAERSVRRGKPIGDAPAVHTAKRPYSILRAFRLQVEHLPLDGVEGEISREIAIRRGKDPKGFYMPTGSDPEMLALMYPGRKEVRRDLTTSTGAGGVFLVPELPLIELLRNKMVMKQLGARYLNNLKGTFAIPRQSAQSTVYWVAEGVPSNPSNPTIDQVPFTPKVAIALTNISREFMNQTSVDAEEFVKEDLAETMAVELDRVAINGSGGTQPTGILQNSTILSNSAGIALGTNGGAMTYQAAVAMQGLVSSFNAERGKLAYLTSPALRAELKSTPKIAPASGQAGYPVFVWEDGTADDEGKVNGMRAMVTNNVPTNLTKGSTTGTCKAIIYGNFNDLIIGTWEGVDTLVNPYTNQAAGAVIISMAMSADVEVRHPQSFAVITDAT
jgi:HK97 family phage major capsid protein